MVGEALTVALLEAIEEAELLEQPQGGKALIIKPQSPKPLSLEALTPRVPGRTIQTATLRVWWVKP